MTAAVDRSAPMADNVSMLPTLRIPARAAALALGAALALAGCAPSPPAASVPARTVTLEVGGMVCPACSLKVRGELARVPGVRAVDLSLMHQRAVVTCAATVADTTLTDAVRRAGPEYLGLVVSK